MTYPQIGYYLDESRGWAVSIPELERAVLESRKTCNPRAIVIINPGNPTGKIICHTLDLDTFIPRQQVNKYLLYEINKQRRRKEIKINLYFEISLIINIKYFIHVII